MFKTYSPKKKVSADTWYNYDWPKRTSITIDDTKVAADLTDFPVLINSTNVDWKSVENGGFVAQDDGGDFLFTASDNTTKLSHEIEKYDPATGELIAWVKVPSLANSSDTIINLYFGNAADDNQWDVANVWGTATNNVWHLKEDPAGTPPQILDSTARNNRGTSNGSMTAADVIAGKIGSGIDFDGNDYINFATPSTVIDNWSMSAWVRPASLAGGEQGIIANGNNSNGYGVFVQGAALKVLYSGVAWIVPGYNFVNTTDWVHVVAVRASGTLRVYVNGAQLATTSTSNPVAPTGATTFEIGHLQGYPGRYLTGQVDEARFSIEPKSAQYIATEYNNQNSPETFYSIAESVDGDTTPPTNPTSIIAKDQSGGEVSLTSENWYSYSSPYFEWSGATDPESVVKGYFVYYGTDQAADPVAEGAFQANPDDDYIGSGMVAGSTYYLRVVTENNATTNNLSSAITLFTYKYDPTVPSAPEYINISPVGCSTNTSFTFAWPAGIDTGGSQIAGYDYRRGSTGAIQQTTALTVTASSYQEGDNVFYLRSRDVAGNLSTWQTAVYCSTATVQVADGPTVTSGPSTMTVAWTSTKNTTSYVRVYEGNDYVSEQGQTSYTMTHSVKVVGLEPEKSYRYKLVWSDESGNLGESEWFNTTTSTAPQVNDLKVDLLGPTSANVSWKDSISANNTIQYGESAYSTTIDTSGLATTGSYKLENLVSGKTYQLRINATSEDGTRFFAGTSFSMPPLPEISSVTYEITNGGVPGAIVSWRTNVETTTSLFYGPQGSSKKEIATSDKVKDHTANITSLPNSSTYEFFVAGTDIYGNKAQSSVLSFSTPADRRPPTISDIVTETSNVGLNKQDKAQIIVSWRTDEPSSSLVEYDLGLTGSEYKQRSSEDKNMTDSHIVILSDLQPSQPYHLRVVSIDKEGNKTESEDITIIAGDVPKSIFNIITNSFENVFGWLGKII